MMIDFMHARANLRSALIHTHSNFASLCYRCLEKLCDGCANMKRERIQKHTHIFKIMMFSSSFVRLFIRSKFDCANFQVIQIEIGMERLGDDWQLLNENRSNYGRGSSFSCDPKVEPSNFIKTEHFIEISHHNVLLSCEISSRPSI